MKQPSMCLGFKTHQNTLFLVNQVDDKQSFLQNRPKTRQSNARIRQPPF